MNLLRYEFDGMAGWGAERGGNVAAIVGDIFSEFEIGEIVAPIDQVRVLAPWVGTKIIAFALNYPGVAGANSGEGFEPLLFLKGSNAVIGQGDDIRYPNGLSGQAWIEVELALIIKKRASNVAPDRAHEHILGYTIANDVTAQNVFDRDHHLARSKSMDTFCPLGPVVVTDFPADGATMVSRVNSAVAQQGKTSDRLADDAACLSIASRHMTLEPGDVLLTGTPRGTGPNTDGVVHAGDEVELEIAGIGILKNRVVEDNVQQT